MCGGGSTPRLQQPQPVPSPPSRSSAEVASEAAKERQRIARKRGRSSTVLTGPGGVTGENVGLKTVLGSNR